MNPVSTRKLAVWSLVVMTSAVSALAAAPVSRRSAGAGAEVHVSGSVTDGSGHAWPLFARIEITSPTTDPVVVFTDPVSGSYGVDLPDGVGYEFSVTAVGPGYTPGGGSVVTSGEPVVADWTLTVTPLCEAAGYGAGNFSPVLSESFDAGGIPSGWTVQSVSGAAVWKVMTDADPCGQFEGNRTGGSGAFAIVNSNCDNNFFDPDETYLLSPPIDLSSSPNAVLRWANDFIIGPFGDVAEVEVTVDGGASWTSVWRATDSVPGPATQIVDLAFAAGHAGVQVRFHYQSPWGFWWQVDDVTVGPWSCPVVSGGLVVGTVSNANTGLGVNGATVTDLSTSGSVTTVDSPDQGNGFYSLFAAGGGARSLQAAAELHTTVTKSAVVAPDAVVRVDFSLPAGILAASPRPLSAVLAPGVTQTLTLEVTNSGTGDGTFVIHEVDATPEEAPADAGSRARASTADLLAARRQLRSKAYGPRESFHLSNAPTNVPVAAGAGNVISTFPTNLAAGYGLAYDTGTDRLWVSNSDAPRAGLVGDGLDYQFRPDGSSTGETIDLQGASSDWQGDGTYNARTGMIWQTGITYLTDGPNQCLFEIDPTAHDVTGHRICGPWSNYPPLVGLAYDYATDTYFAGDSLGGITRVDGAGNVVGSGNINLQISGLAYNPTTGHLFVATPFYPQYDIWVVDPSRNYLVLGGFRVTNGGERPVSIPASLEADCLGHLWTYDVASNQVYQFESGESGWCVADIPWLSVTPTSGTLPGAGVPAAPGGGNALPVSVTFDAAGLAPGLRLRSLVFTTDTPDPVPPVPVDLTVLFNDVPPGSFLANYIYGAAGAGVMPGCAPRSPSFSFCPSTIATRRDVAAYIERAVHGTLTPPPVYTGQFDDVLLDSPNASYIQGLADDGITSGCSVQPRLYCPDVPVKRSQMAVFLWRGQHGLEPPPACTPPGVFADVSCPGGFAVDYIEAIAAEGITLGCGGGYYCPNAGMTNAQAATFLVRAFGLPSLP